MSYNKPFKAWALFSPNQLETMSASCKILTKQSSSPWSFLSMEGKNFKRPKKVQHSRECSLGIDTGLRDSLIGTVNAQFRYLRHILSHLSLKSIHRQKKATRLPGPEVSAGHFPVQTLKFCRQTNHPPSEQGQPLSVPEQANCGHLDLVLWHQCIFN